MSNVLIGIIGVILFIGLALAGALFLGDRFSDTKTESDVASISTAMQQVADAMNLYRLENGVQDIKNQKADFLKAGNYLANVPNAKSPYGRTRSTEYLYQLHLNNDVYPDTHDEGGPIASYVTIGIGPSSDPQSRKICQSMAKRSQMGKIDTSGMPKEEIGCSETYSVLTAFKKI